MFREQAVQLVDSEPDPERPNQLRLRINEPGAEVLRGFPTPLAVFSICGPSNSGKSTLLNLLLIHLFGISLEKVRSCGFVARDQARGTTSGIWFWGAPLELKGRDGNTVNVLLMDTEGTGQGSEEITTSLGCIAMLTSTILCLNIQGYPANDSLRLLSILDSLLSFASNQTKARAFSPKLFLVGRNLPSGQNPEAIVQAWLQPPRGAPELEQCCRAVESCFPFKRFYPLTGPGSEEAIEALPYLDVAKGTNFVKGVRGLIEEVRVGLFPPKQLDGAPLSGADVVNIVRQTLDTPRQLVSLPNFLQAMNRERCEKAVRVCLAAYEQCWASYQGEDFGAQDASAKGVASNTLDCQMVELNAGESLKGEARRLLDERLIEAGARHNTEVQRRIQVRLELKLQEEKRLKEQEEARLQELARQQEEARKQAEAAQAAAAAAAAAVQAEQKRQADAAAAQAAAAQALMAVLRHGGHRRRKHRRFGLF